MSLDEVLSRQPAPASRPAPVWPLPAVIIGTLVEVAPDGAPLVDFDGNRTARPLPARSMGSVDCSAIGSAVALLFEDGDPARPIIMGLIHCTEDAGVPETANAAVPAEESALRVENSAGGRRVVLSSDKEIELRCGKASITLTRAGKVLIRGAYVLSRSSGANRIKGGSVQIN
jgi:uncharacterized protein involved in type VI secretion and phage assembly